MSLCNKFGSIMAYVTGLKLYPMAEFDVQCVKVLGFYQKVSM